MACSCWLPKTEKNESPSGDGGFVDPGIVISRSDEWNLGGHLEHSSVAVFQTIRLFFHNVPRAYYVCGSIFD